MLRRRSEQADVEARWGTSTLGNGINVNSPYLWGYDQAWDVYMQDTSGGDEMVGFLQSLSSTTSAHWTDPMLIALASSYCNDWSSEEHWAREIAPVLGVTIADARTAIDSGYWIGYQANCA